jgi:hypothetical protein
VPGAGNADAGGGGQDGGVLHVREGATKSAGGQGFADVWWEGRFAWEYKGHRGDLKAAYQQLLQYREDLGNPPLLVVCDLDRFEVQTNFTGTKKEVHAFGVDDLDRPEVLAVLRAVFSDPEALRPGQTAEDVTVEAAARFGALIEAGSEVNIDERQVNVAEG